MAKKILIIDDDIRNVFALSAVLRARGYAIDAAGSAAEGLDLISDGTAVVLMDMMMPEMDGYEALARIRQDGAKRHVPVIAVTAQAMKGDRERCLAAGANGYIPKPIDVDVLVQLLQEYL